MKFEVVTVGELEPDFVSSRIQAVQSSMRGFPINYSHAAVIVTGAFGQRVFDATGRGISECTLEELLDQGGAKIRRRFVIPVRREEFALGWIQGRLGVRYSNLQYLGFLFPFLRWIPGVRNGRGGAVCSEFVADFLHDCSNLNQKCFSQSEWMMPVDLVDQLEFLRVTEVSE